MSSFKTKLIILTSSLFVLGAATVYAEPRDESLEQALLQQLHPVVYSSLQGIYHEKYAQYKCIRIVSINERSNRFEEASKRVAS